MELLIGSALCLMHLGIGMAIGWRLRPEGRYVESFELPASRHGRIEYVESQWCQLHVQLTQLTTTAIEIQPAPRELLSQWLTELDHVTSQLRFTVEGNSSPLLPAPDSEQHAEEQPTVATNEQILELVGRPASDEEVVRRFSFPVKQPLAKYVDAGPLPAKAFSPVQCHDLSVRDIRFFLDEPPTADKVVLGLGVPQPVKWMGAEVESFRSVFMYGRVGYLVIARFLSCIDKRVSNAP